MMSAQTSNKELYNLRWNSFSTNLVRVFTDLQTQGNLVDVTLSCEGKFIKAHKLVLAASSLYFQKIFDTHPIQHLVILFNDSGYKELQLIVDFMYTGEVKVANSDIQKFLQLGKRLQVKGLCGVEIKETSSQQANLQFKSSQNNSTESIDEQFVSTNDFPNSPTQQPSIIAEKDPLELDVDPLILPKKRKRSVKTTPSSVDNQDIVEISKPKSPVRPPSAFMIFTNQWRKKLTAEYPGETTKQISLRLCNMWKSLSQETKECFYEDARRMEQEFKRKNSTKMKETALPEVQIMDPSRFVAIEINDDSRESDTNK